MNVTLVFSNGIAVQDPPLAILALLSLVVTAVIPGYVTGLGNEPALAPTDLKLIWCGPKSTDLLPIPVIRSTWALSTMPLT